MGYFMSTTISSVSSPKMYTYNLKGQRVTVTLTNNPFDFEPQTLFSLAARKNKKRRFLFVSKVLGKHVPVDPFVPLLAGAALAVQFMRRIQEVEHADTLAIIQALKSNEDTRSVYETVINRSLIALSDKTLFIGFAETATALGHAVFSLFDNAYYLHTTREQIPLLASELNFNEEHSHAVNHRCYPLDAELIKTPKTIILVDDEITTGNTALNIIRAIHAKFPKTNYVVLSLLDWRTAEDRANFRKLEQQLDIKILTTSLLEGEIAVSGDPVNEQSDHFNHAVSPDICESPVYPELKFLNLRDLVSVFSEDSAGNKNVSPYLLLTGRFGLSTLDNQEILPLAREIGEELKCDRIGEKTLCLGTGEFMYFPMLVSAYMGKGISFHTTTRSPIYSFAKPQYGIQNGFSFENPDESSTANYVYNVPFKYYDEVYVFFEREVSHERLTSILKVFRELGIPRLVLVYCAGHKVIDRIITNRIPDPLPIGSYNPKDVIFLLKNLNGLLAETDLQTREQNIQSGGHYSEMLPIEYEPTKEYLDLFHLTLRESASKVAEGVGIVAESILKRNGPKMVLVSLARAGTPIGVLIKRYLLEIHDLDLPHYSISIIRGKGIDENAILYILQNHPASKIQFIDGWTGKGAITSVLSQACTEFEGKYGYELDDDLAVLADPGYCVKTFGTREDFLIPSACLNSTVSGLVSRTVFRTDLIEENEFHGARFYKELLKEEVSNLFVDTISAEFKTLGLRHSGVDATDDQVEGDDDHEGEVTWQGLKALTRIKETFGITDINFIKPGIGETTRVLLRRLPERILVDNMENPNLKHILLLAKDKGVPVEEYPDLTYSCCGLVKQI